MEHKTINKQSIAVFGEILADVFPYKTVSGGAPFNVARHLNAFQTHPVLISRTGDDALKKSFIDEFERLGLDQIGMQCDPTKPTGQVSVTLKGGQPSYEIVDDQAYDHIHAGMTHLTLMAIKPVIKYFGTLAQRSLYSRLALDTFIHDKPCPLFLDLNLREPWYNKQIITQSLVRCQYAKMNADELSTVAQLFNMQANTDEALGKSIQQQFSLSQLIVTCGDAGSWVIDHEGLLTHQTACKPTSMVDTVGAGDAFAAVYLLGILHQWSVPQSLARADQFASAICGVRGAVPESFTFYNDFIQSWGL